MTARVNLSKTFMTLQTWIAESQLHLVSLRSGLDCSFVEEERYTAAGKHGATVESGATITRFLRAIISAGAFTSLSFLVAFGRRGFTYGAAGTHGTSAA